MLTMSAMSHVMFLVCAIGMAIISVQLLSLFRHLRERPPLPTRFPPISVLKPLCGVDDDLPLLIERFARLDYPDYEVLLGVRSTSDAAYPLACEAARRHPGRLRVVVQKGEPGLNPKVNQLITLTAAARHDLLVISDSNVLVEPGYLTSIAGYFEDPSVGLVTHPVAGVGEETLGSLLDNLHMSGSIGPGMVAVQGILGQDLVVGKSMAVRRGDIARIGGFESMRDLLAEDFLIGQRIGHDLGKRIVIAHDRVWNLSRRRTVAEFLARYNRWSVMHRMAVGPVVYLGGVVLNPLAAAVLGFLLSPSLSALEWVGAVALSRSALDGLNGGLLRRKAFTARQLAAVPMKDALFFAAWCYGLTHESIEWRGNRLRVLPGTWLERPDSLPPPTEVDSEVPHAS